MSRQTGSAHHGEMLRLKRPDLVTYVDVFLVFGQSEAAQTTPDPNLAPFSTEADIAWAVARYPSGDRTVSGPFQNGTSVSPHFGKSNGWVKWAQEWYDQTGRKSLWAGFPIAGQQLCSITGPSAPQQWSVEDMSKSLVGDFTYGSDQYTRRQLLHHVFEAPTYNPRFVIDKRYIIWAQGIQDANVGASGIEAEYAVQLDALFTFCKTEWQIDAFFIVETGRRGTDAAEMATWEPQYQMVRNAQNAVATSRADAFMVFDKCKETGSPFNTMTVDGNGYWASGYLNQPDGHGETASYYTLGKTAARNAILALGL